MDVLHEGYLEKCLNPDESKREWRKRYFVLKKALGSGTQTLEYFKDKEWRKQEPKGILTLFSGYTAEKVYDSKKKLLFEVKTIDNYFVLSATTDESRDKWIETLWQNSSARSYSVTIQETQKSDEVGMKPNEKCILQITSTNVLLLLGNSPPISIPFNCIRRYKCHPGSFLLEVGRKAPTGEGEFRFHTQDGEDIFEYLAKAVSGRMNAKQESKPDFVSSFAAMATQNNDRQGILPPHNVSKQNPFFDVMGASDVRFFMKKRSTSSPPPSPPPVPPFLPTPPSEFPKSPPMIQDDISAYSHLSFGFDKPRDCEGQDDIDLRARAKQCNRFNKTRASESDRKPSVSSSNKALKVLGLLRSNSAENLQRVGSVSKESDSSDTYAHLERGKNTSQKSQSTSNILEELKGSPVILRRTSVSETEKIEDDVFASESGGLYNKLRGEKEKRNALIQEDNVYNLLNEGSKGGLRDKSEDAYDKLGSNQDGGYPTQQTRRPAPIVVDATYDALSFGADQAKFEESSNAANIFNPVKSPRSTLDKSNGYKNIVGEKKAGFRPPVLKPKVPVRPSISKKPMPSKPPRKNIETGSDEGEEDSTKVCDEEFKGNLISKLKKNFQNQDTTNRKSPLSPPSPIVHHQKPSSPPLQRKPLMPPTNHIQPAKKLIEPFYAVSPFTSGKISQPIAPSEYDVPMNNTAVVAPVVASKQNESKQPHGFLYAVSPFHSGNKQETALLPEILYDTPSISQVARAQYDNVNPMNTYDTPVNQVLNSTETSLYDTPMQHSSGPSHFAAKTDPPSQNNNMQFMYAVSPFASGHGGSPIQSRSAQSCDVQMEEAAYCEVADIMAGFSLGGYDSVGATISSGSPEKEPIYSVPRT